MGLGKVWADTTDQRQLSIGSNHHHALALPIIGARNEPGIPTARGNGQWSAVQVARVIERRPG